MDSLVNLDRELFLWFNGLGIPLFDSFWMMMTNKLTNVVVYLITALYFYRKTSLKEFLGVLFFVALLILATDQTTNLFKYQFGRLRPCHDPDISHLVRLVKSSCGGKFSFFSGHASNSFALASFFSLLMQPYLRKLSYFLFFIAGLIAYSRVYIGVHFPLDILVGSSVGTLIGILFFRFWKTFIQSRLR